MAARFTTEGSRRDDDERGAWTFGSSLPSVARRARAITSRWQGARRLRRPTARPSLFMNAETGGRSTKNICDDAF
jgi:hypothetical protein